jgi:hypothetical protein
VGAASVGGFVIGLLLVQLIVAAVAWGRIARLYGMASLARDAQHRHARRAHAEPSASHHVPVTAGASPEATAVA